MAENEPIHCPACQKKFKTKADVRGKRIKCPFCTESFVVPMVDEPKDDDDAPIPIQGMPKPQPVAASAGGAEEEEGDDPYSVTKLDLAPRCPNCANEMPSADAVVCLICGYNTLTREWGRTEKTVGVTAGNQFVHLLPGIFAFMTLLSCMISLLIYAAYWPYWVANSWADWTDHESLRMWGTTLGLLSMAALGSYCFQRFIVKPLPDEVKLD